MRAILCTKYGTPDVLQLQEVEQPTPKDNEVLIKMYASSVTSGDARIRRADPFIIRLIFGFKKPRKAILGAVVAGDIASVGKAVTKFKIGDPVFGSSNMNFGAHAEYTRVPENAALALKPTNLSYEAAAAIPFGATAALHFLRKGNIQKGQKVLIYGASGALGTTAVQLAKVFGAEVTAVCSTSNIELVKSLGADNVIDYTKEDFTQNGKKYDVIFETVGKAPFSKSLGSLNKKGLLLMASAGFGLMLRGAIISILGSKKVVSGVIHETAADMRYLKELIENEQLKAVIDKVYPLEEIAEAHAHVDKGHKKGNVIITMN